MKTPYIVGAALAVVVLAAGLFSPMLRSSERKSAEAAQRQAALAQRQLARVSLALQTLEAMAAPKELAASPLEGAVERAGTELRKRSEAAAQQARSAEAMGERHGWSSPKFESLSPSVAGVKRALNEFQQGVRDNEALLKAAIADAQSAVSTNAAALGVPQSLGMAEYARAASLLFESQGLRDQQARQQSLLIGLGAQWRLARGAADHFQGLDVAPIIDELRGSAEEVAALRAKAEAKLAELRAQVAERERELGGVVDQMRATRSEMLALEKESFVAGDDQSFVAYRQKHENVTARLQALELQEQELRYGGRRGAEIAGDNLVSGEISGGETIDGLEELQRRLDLAEERAKRVAGANVALDEYVRHMTASGEEAQTESGRYESRLAELDSQQKAVMEELQSLANQANDKEDQALKSAQAAVRAFGQSQNSAAAYVRNARERQRERDPNHKNEVLAAIMRDGYLEAFGPSAEGAARMLEARICAQRADACRALIHDLAVFAEMKPGTEFDTSTAQERLAAAEKQGLETLEKARATYEKLAGGPAATSWVPQATLAAALHLTARLDQAQATSWLEKSMQALQKALEKREQSPYLRQYVLFQEHLQEGQPGPAEEAGDDLFSDEKP